MLAALGDLRTALLVIAIDVEKLKPRCGKMAEQYSLLEAGHVAQNVLLQTTASRSGQRPGRRV